MKTKLLWLRRIHKWIGLAIGLQVLLWAVSGAGMALLSMDEVAGGASAASPGPPTLEKTEAWSRIRASLAGAPIAALKLRPLLGRQAAEIEAAGKTLLFDTADGRPLAIDRATARAVAVAAHPGRDAVLRTTPLSTLDLAVREHRLPIWRVDFADQGNSSYYVSGTNGAVLERRNDTWRWWDFFWMLHTMDYARRTSFNHPLIVAAGFAMAWLAVTGVWLLLTTTWRRDFAWAGRTR